MDFAPVFSSSDGNMYLFQQDDTVIMIDMGVPGTHLLTQAQRFLGDLSKLRGIFLTHAHGDHIGGLIVFLKHYEEAMAKEGKTPHLKIYASATCLKQVKHKFDEKALTKFKEAKVEARDRYEGEALDERLTLLLKREKEKTATRKGYYTEYLEEISGPMDLAPFHIEPIKVAHDTECHAYRVSVGDICGAVCVDLGSWSDKVAQSLEGVQLLLLEANYNEALLRKAYKGAARKGLRNRILGAFGHLSNEEAIGLAVKLHETALHTVIFGHMSSNSNSKEKLQETMTEILGETPPFQTLFAPSNEEIGDCWYHVETGESHSL